MEGIGLLSIPGGILCKKDVLGQSFSGTISGCNINIVFPSLSDDSSKDNLNHVGMSNRLKAPADGTKLRLDGEMIIWGYPMMAPQMNSFVKYVIVEVDCNELESNRLAQNLYAGAQDWAHSFKCFLQLLTKQQLERKLKASTTGNNLQLIIDGKHVQNQQPQVLQAHFHTDNDFASCEEIKQAIDFASSGKELFLEYQMLLSAYNSRKEGANRQAIIDACSAVEICLVNQITSYCNQKGLDPDILINKYRYLGDRFSLVKKLDINSPSFDFDKVIVKPRNKVAHNRDAYPTNECTDELIEMVENYLTHYHTSYY